MALGITLLTGAAIGIIIMCIKTFTDPHYKHLQHLWYIVGAGLVFMMIALSAQADDRPPMIEFHYNELTDRDIYVIEKQRERTRKQAKWTGTEDEGWGTYNDKVWIDVSDEIGYISFPKKAFKHNSYNYKADEVVQFYINKAVDEYNHKKVSIQIEDIKDRLFEINNEITKTYGLLLLTGKKPNVEQTQQIVELLTEQEDLLNVLNDIKVTIK